MAQRYELRIEEDKNWTVIDRFTGTPAEHEGELLVGLEMEDADDLVDLLNGVDRARRGEPRGPQ